MSAEADPEGVEVKKGSKMPLLLGLVLALAGGGGGFFAVNSGMLGGAPVDSDHAESPQEAPPTPLPSLAFVPLDPFIVSVGEGADQSLLRFTAQLEVSPDYAADVEGIKPRIVDALNGYLRAVELADLSDPTVLVRLRGQMLRRVQVVAGEGRVKDLLIMEFVLN